MDKKAKLKASLADMSEEQKLLLFDVLQEKKRRARDRRANYKPNEGQVKVHKTKKWLRAVFAGNGSGKTALAANEALWAAQGYNPITQEFTKVPARVIVLLDDPYKSDSLWIGELCKWHNFEPEKQFHKRGKPYTSQITFPNGSEIVFMAHGQEALAFESIEADYLIMDEPPPRPIYVALIRGLRKPGRKPWVLLVGTPISCSWMRQEILEPWQRGERPDVECFTYGTLVNKHNLAEGYLERMEVTLSEKERRVRLNGEFFDLEGLALVHLFREEQHVIEGFDWEPSNPCVIAIDPHPSKAHYACLLGVDQNDYLYYIDEIKQKLPARLFMEYIIERGWFDSFRVIDIVVDSLGSADTTSGEGFRSFIEVINEVLSEQDEDHPRARATTYKEKSEEDFIERMRECLLIPDAPDVESGILAPKLRIFKGNVGIVQDIRNVQWARYAKHRGLEDNKPSLDITNKDYLSTLKYALAANLYFKKPHATVYRRTAGPSTYGAPRRPNLGHKKPEVKQLRWRPGRPRRNSR